MEQKCGDVVLIPGWGMRSSVWKSLDLELRSSYRLFYPNFDDCEHPEQFAPAVLREVHEIKPVFLIGWSLGGMLALQLAAQEPDRFEQVIVIGAGCKFVSDDTCLAGQPVAVVNRLKRNLERNPAGTLRSFYESLFSAQDRAEQLDQILLNQARDWPPSPINSLQAGLDYLMYTDLRDQLKNIRSQVTVIHGQQDPISPIEAGRWLADHVAGAKLVEMAGAGHMPLGFQGTEFCGLIRSALLT